MTCSAPASQAVSTTRWSASTTRCVWGRLMEACLLEAKQGSYAKRCGTTDKHFRGHIKFTPVYPARSQEGVFIALIRAPGTRRGARGENGTLKWGRFWTGGKH